MKKTRKQLERELAERQLAELEREARIREKRKTDQVINESNDREWRRQRQWTAWGIGLIVLAAFGLLVAYGTGLFGASF